MSCGFRLQNARSLHPTIHSLHVPQLKKCWAVFPDIVPWKTNANAKQKMGLAGIPATTRVTEMKSSHIIFFHCSLPPCSHHLTILLAFNPGLGRPFAETTALPCTCGSWPQDSSKLAIPIISRSSLDESTG